jgi:ribitol-5-phosphate 2-dehydrogenase
MLNAVYQLVEPRRFETVFQEINVTSDKILVRPTYLSICHADQRYYQGSRPAEILAKKLPMALLHECIGEIVYDPKGELKPGQRVVLIPNTPTQQDEVIAENYLRSSKFRSSSMDGFMQDYVPMERDRLVKLPGNINNEVAAFTELQSVSVHALSRFAVTANNNRNIMGIWGDGNLGYITAVFCKAMFPQMKLYIFGVHGEKLADFTFADEVYHINQIPEDLQVDHAFECVGGPGSQQAVEQIIDHIQPEGTISMMGVSEYPIPINTRMVLEKGLKLVGSSRSGREDFVKTIEICSSHPDIINYLSNIVGAVVPVRSLSDVRKAFEMDLQKSGGKTILEWNK